MPQNDPVLSMLGLCRRAGRLSVGTEAVMTAIKRKKSRLVVIASDISPKTEKELRFTAKDTDLPIIRIPHPLLEVGHAIGVGAGVVSVDDDGFAGAIVKKIELSTPNSEE